MSGITLANQDMVVERGEEREEERDCQELEHPEEPGNSGEEDEEEDEDEVEEEEEEDGEGEQSLRYQMGSYAVKERRLPLESTLLGTCWLAFVRRRPLKAGHRRTAKSDAACRLLYERSEMDTERAAREASGVQLDKMRTWPRWVTNSRLCAGLLQNLEKEERGPSSTIKEEFPLGQVKDLPAMSARLLDLAVRNGLGKETITNFKKWLSKCFTSEWFGLVWKRGLHLYLIACFTGTSAKELRASGPGMHTRSLLMNKFVEKVSWQESEELRTGRERQCLTRYTMQKAAVEDISCWQQTEDDFVSGWRDEAGKNVSTPNGDNVK